MGCVSRSDDSSKRRATPSCCWPEKEMVACEERVLGRQEKPERDKQLTGAGRPFLICLLQKACEKAEHQFRPKMAREQSNDCPEAESAECCDLKNNHLKSPSCLERVRPLCISESSRANRMASFTRE
jgi:hypothetical protein